MHKICNMENFFFPTYSRFPGSFIKGRGVYLYDKRGKKYLDLISGVGVNALGYGNPAILKSIKKQLGLHLHISNLFMCESQLNFAREIAKTVNFNFRIFLCNSGAEATETAIKLIRIYHHAKKNNKYKVLCFKNSFHGRTIGALSATYKREIKEPFEPLLDGFEFIDFDIPKVERMILGGDFAGVLIEPIQGESGVILPPRDVFTVLRKATEKTDTLLVFDEIQTGCGRTGKFWCYENFGVVPDVILSAKAIGGGLPLGCVIAKEEIARYMGLGSHASTFGGNPLATAAGAALIKIVRKKSFLESVRFKGEIFKKKIEESVQKNVRGLGLMLGVEVGLPKEKFKDATLFFWKNGILVNFCAGEDGKGVLRLLPPLIISEKQIDSFVKVLKKWIATIT